MINIGSNRELFVDDFIVDTEKTTAKAVLGKPVRRECVFLNDAPWEGNGWIYYTVLQDEDIFRMYYITVTQYNEDKSEHKHQFCRNCYAESKDGIHWTKPNLGICNINGSTENNVIFETKNFTALHVFIDKNPECPKEERYKALYNDYRKDSEGKDIEPAGLYCLVSADGIHFKYGWPITEKGTFDSLNTFFWDELKNIYVCYLRDYHENEKGERVRNICRTESNDCKNWTDPERITYNEESPYDFNMYTNGIQPYFRAPHIYVGFPTRYNERKEWTANYDRLCGKEHRKWRMQFKERFGLALTDGLFMSSRDGKHFNRWNEAFLRPGPESNLRWVYGDCYLSYGMLPTKTNIDSEDCELSFYAASNHWSDEKLQVFRYSIRMDGFVGYNAGFEPKTLVTKVFTFDGDNLYINFSTSAAGYIRIIIEDEKGSAIEGYDSGDLFGDSVDRIVDFEKSVSNLKGKNIKMRIELCDADIFSFQFRD